MQLRILAVPIGTNLYNLYFETFLTFVAMVTTEFYYIQVKAYILRIL